MVSARKMFEELGYNTPVEQTPGHIIYYTGYVWNRQEVLFNLKEREVYIDAKHIKPALARAIDKQCEELGWHE